jgi:hypothetical protein
MRGSDVKRIIENLEDALKVHPDKGYEIGSLEEYEKFSRNRLGGPGKNFESCETDPENKLPDNCV